MPNCYSCHYEKINKMSDSNEESNFINYEYKPVCDVCFNGYYLDPETKTCLFCHNVPIDGGSCQVCKEKNYKIF